MSVFSVLKHTEKHCRYVLKVYEDRELAVSMKSTATSEEAIIMLSWELGTGFLKTQMNAEHRTQKTCPWAATWKPWLCVIFISGGKWWWGREEPTLPFLAPLKAQQQHSCVLVANTKPTDLPRGFGSGPGTINKCALYFWNGLLINKGPADATGKQSSIVPRIYWPIKLVVIVNCKWFPLCSSLYQFLTAPIEKKSFFITLLVYLGPDKWTEKCGTIREHLNQCAPESKRERTRKCKQTEDSQQADQNTTFGTFYRNKPQKLFPPYIWLLVNKINKLVGGELREYNVNQSRRCYCFARQQLDFT